MLINARYEILQETVSAYRKEIATLQERSQKMSAAAQQHEHVIHTMSQDLRRATERAALEEVSALPVRQRAHSKRRNHGI